MSNEKTAHLHQTRAATEKQQYDKLRSGGVTHDNARRISQKGSTLAHRSLDRRAAKK